MGPILQNAQLEIHERYSRALLLHVPLLHFDKLVLYAFNTLPETKHRFRLRRILLQFRYELHECYWVDLFWQISDSTRREELSNYLNAWQSHVYDRYGNSCPARQWDQHLIRSSNARVNHNTMFLTSKHTHLDNALQNH